MKYGQFMESGVDKWREAWIIRKIHWRDVTCAIRLSRSQWTLWIGAITLCLLGRRCKPDDSPFKAENEALRKQLAKQESVVTSLQDGNKVMHQQIDLLNQELRDATKSAESAKAEAKSAADNLAIQTAQTKKLSADVQKTAAAQAAQSIQVEEKGAQTEDLPRPLSTRRQDCGRSPQPQWIPHQSEYQDRPESGLRDRAESLPPCLARSRRLTESIRAVPSCTPFERHPAQRQGRLRKARPGWPHPQRERRGGRGN